MGYGSGAGRGAGPTGSRVRYGPTGRAQRIKTGGHQWSDEAEELFFDHLAASCNVRGSAEAVGFTTYTVYRQRRLRPEFAEKWRIALAQGYARLEMALVEAAVDSLEEIDFDADRPIPRLTVEQAMNLLKLHGPEVREERAGRPGRLAAPKSVEYYRESILRKIAAIRAARGAAGTGGWGRRGGRAAGSRIRSGMTE